MFKFGTIGMFKSAKNNPRVQATAETKPGYVFKITDNYTSGGSKSKVDITVGAGTVVDGTITFNIGGQNVYTPIVGATQTTAALVAAEIKDSLDAVLLGLGYTVSRLNAVITVTAPSNGSSTTAVSITDFDATTTTATFSNAYTAGTDATSYDQAAEASTNDAGAKTDDLYVCMNIIDTPELQNTTDYKIIAGGFINSWNLPTLKGMTVELSSDLVTTAFASVAVGDHLVPVPAGSNAMKWKKAGDTGYACTLKVLEKTTFGGTGFYCKISSN